jgi:hypothetical protein
MLTGRLVREDILNDACVTYLKKRGRQSVRRRKESLSRVPEQNILGIETLKPNTGRASLQNTQDSSRSANRRMPIPIEVEYVNVPQLITDSDREPISSWPMMPQSMELVSFFNLNLLMC